ncbi:metal-sensing transcriptional repressor [Ruminococcaceae bacterium OttesenSCG-928-L11]|nr:metal-sensing transcriptional repressor [Ruminococcaceae bacterium OttesenSCG-928-L11]
MQADYKRVTKLLKTARGQLGGILRMVEEDKYCVDISHQILACDAVLRRANREILQAHLESCVQGAFHSGSKEETDAKIQELVELIGKLSK